MKTFVIASACWIVAGIGQVSAADPASQLFGRWRSAETSQGGLGVVVEFRPGQNYRWSPSPIVSSSYQRSGDQLSLEVSDRGGRTTRISYKIEKLAERELVLSHEKGRMELKRTGAIADPKNLLLGGWAGPYPAKQFDIEQHIYFYPDGTHLFTLPIRWQVGQFSIRNGQITMTQTGQTAWQGPVEQNGNEVTLPSAATGKPLKFLRY